MSRTKIAFSILLLAACGGRADLLDPSADGGGDAAGGAGAQGGAQGGAGAQGGIGAQGGATGGGGQPPECVSNDQCPVIDDACVEFACIDGSCQLVDTPNGTPCFDGLICTDSDSCQNGVCVGGPPAACPPSPDPCFVTVCDEAASGCVPVPTDGAICDDGNPCSGDGTCMGGMCAPAPEDCSALGGTCKVGVCGPNGCFAQNAPNGTACDDGNPCTTNDQCSAGMCAGTGGSVVYFSEDFSDNAAGWTLGTEWQIGPAMASMGPHFGNHDPSLDHTPTADNGVAGVVIGGFASTMIHPFRWLESPPFDATIDPGPVVLSFWRWLNSDWAPWMTNRVEVFDGNSWVVVWQSGGPPPITDNSWTEQTFDLTPHKNAAMRIRFGFDVGLQGAFTVSQWNVDDIVVSTALCP